MNTLYEGLRRKGGVEIEPCQAHAFKWILLIVFLLFIKNLSLIDAYQEVVSLKCSLKNSKDALGKRNNA